MSNREKQFLEAREQKEAEEERVRAMRKNKLFRDELYNKVWT